MSCCRLVPKTSACTGHLGIVTQRSCNDSTFQDIVREKIFHRVFVHLMNIKWHKNPMSRNILVFPNRTHFEKSMSKIYRREPS